MERPPLSEARLYDVLINAESELRPKADRIWETIKIAPERWHLPVYGSGSRSFWAVGLIAKRVLWYNEIEAAFSLSSYKTYGQIGDQHHPGETELRLILEYLIREIEGEQAYTR
jgi:hypothetical protein